jgi:hypothetical protein
MGPLAKQAAVCFSLLVTAGCNGCPPRPANTFLTGYEIVTGTSATVGAQATSTANAVCPGAKVPIGGGFRTADQASNVFDSAPLESLSPGGGRGWQVTLKNENPPVIGMSIAASAVAVCVDPPAGYVVNVTSTNLSRGQRIVHATGCPDRTMRIGGGGAFTRDSAVHVGGNAPQVGNGQWEGFFRSDYVVPSNSSVRTAAICASIPALPDVEVVQSPATTIGPSSNASLSVNCPAGKKALSGGIMAPESIGAIFDSLPRPNGSGWTATVRNTETFVTNTSLHATLLAVCATTR